MSDAGRRGGHICIDTQSLTSVQKGAMNRCPAGGPEAAEEALHCASALTGILFISLYTRELRLLPSVGIGGALYPGKPGGEGSAETKINSARKSARSKHNYYGLYGTDGKAMSFMRNPIDRRPIWEPAVAWSTVFKSQNKWSPLFYSALSKVLPLAAWIDVLQPQTALLWVPQDTRSDCNHSQISKCSELVPEQRWNFLKMCQQLIHIIRDQFGWVLLRDVTQSTKTGLNLWPHVYNLPLEWDLDNINNNQYSYLDKQQRHPAWLQSAKSTIFINS